MLTKKEQRLRRARQTRIRIATHSRPSVARTSLTAAASASSEARVVTCFVSSAGSAIRLPRTTSRGNGISGSGAVCAASGAAIAAPRSKRERCRMPKCDTEVVACRVGMRISPIAIECSRPIDARVALADGSRYSD